MALIQCSECGREVSDKAAACPGCGAPIAAPAASPAPAAPAVQQVQIVRQPKSRGVYIILGLLLGLLGIHNFYAGYNGSAVAQLLITLLTGWLIFPLILVALWVIVELIVTDEDASGVKMA